MCLPRQIDRLIAQPQDTRYVPDDVFCFPRPDLWKPTMWSILSDLLTQEVKEEFLRRPPSYVLSDDLGWLDEIILMTSDRMPSIKQVTAERMASHFRAFRASHGTRSDDLEQFYEAGLRRLRSDEFDKIAFDLLVSDDFPFASQVSLNSAIEELDAKGPGCRDGFLYFCADENELIDQAGHYLIYGSEYLYCLAIRVIGTSNARKLLKSRGKPTLFVCDLPFEYLSLDQQEAFAGMCLESMFCELLGKGSEFGHGSAIMIQRDVPPCYIVGHHHPTKIRDPFFST